MTTAPIRSLAREPPNAAGAALEKTKKKKKVHRTPSLTKVLKKDLNWNQKYSYYFLVQEQTSGNCLGHSQNEMILVHKKLKINVQYTQQSCWAFSENYPKCL